MCRLLTSKKPFLLTQGSEQITMMLKIVMRQSPVSPAVPYTQPTPVLTEKKYCQIGSPVGFVDSKPIYMYVMRGGHGKQGFL